VPGTAYGKKATMYDMYPWDAGASPRAAERAATRRPARAAGRPARPVPGGSAAGHPATADRPVQPLLPAARALQVALDRRDNGAPADR